MQTKTNRIAEITRETGETDIIVRLNLDGTGKASIDTGLKFFDHMLTLLSWFSFIDMTIRVDAPSSQPDDHHIIEDVGITLGKAFRKALGEMEWGKVQGINRYGNFAAPMDECLVFCAIDIYTRGCTVLDIAYAEKKVGDVSSASLIHFFGAFAQEARMVINLKTISGGNTHHLFESAFKSLAKAIEQAITKNPKLSLSVPGKL